MRSFSILSLLVGAFVSSQVAVASPGHTSNLAAHRNIVKRHASQAIWNHEKRQASGARFTWYHTGQGACGGYNGEDDWIVALNQYQWDGGSHCGQKITINVNGKTGEATIVDLCPYDSCPFGALDFSPGLFKNWASDPSQTGVLTGDWWFGSGGGGSGDGNGGHDQKTTTHQEETTPPPPPPTSTTSTTSTTPPPPPPSTTSTILSSSFSSWATSDSATSTSTSSSSSESAASTPVGFVPAANIKYLQVILGNLAGLSAGGASIKA